MRTQSSNAQTAWSAGKRRWPSRGFNFKSDWLENGANLLDQCFPFLSLAVVFTLISTLKGSHCRIQSPAFYLCSSSSERCFQVHVTVQTWHLRCSLTNRCPRSPLSCHQVGTNLPQWAMKEWLPSVFSLTQCVQLYEIKYRWPLEIETYFIKNYEM